MNAPHSPLGCIRVAFEFFFFLISSLSLHFPFFFYFFFLFCLKKIIFQENITKMLEYIKHDA